MPGPQQGQKVDVMSGAAMENAYNICHNVQARHILLLTSGPVTKVCLFVQLGSRVICSATYYCFICKVPVAW
jgi:hypothetical protein